MKETVSTALSLIILSVTLNSPKHCLCAASNGTFSMHMAHVRIHLCFFFLGRKWLKLIIQSKSLVAGEWYTQLEKAWWSWTFYLLTSDKMEAFDVQHDANLRVNKIPESWLGQYFILMHKSKLIETCNALSSTDVATVILEVDLINTFQEESGRGHWTRSSSFVWLLTASLLPTTALNNFYS